MIQRIQSIYLIISIICVSIVTAGVNIASFKVEEGELRLSSFGLFLKSESGEKIADPSLPLYLIGLLFILMLFITLIGYKKLSRQIRMAKMNLYFSILLSAAIVITSFVFGSITYGIGTYLLFATILFTFLALRGIKKDKSLLDSVDRIR